MNNRLLALGINAFKWASFYHTFSPRVIEVETTKACNLKCPGCRRNYKDGCIASEPGAMHLTLGHLWRIVATTNCSLLRFEGDGEPLVNPHFKVLVTFCNKMGIKSMMTSNGTLITKEWVKFLEDNGMIRIHVSFDGTTKETYEKVKLGADFDKTLYNCKLIGDSKIQLFMSVVLFSDSIVEELPKYIELSKRVGATGIHFMRMQRDRLDFGTPPDWSKHKGALDEFIKLGKSRNLMMVGSSSEKPTFVRCYDPFINPFVLLNDDVYACTYMANLRRTEVLNNELFRVPYQNYRMGNLNDNWMAEIWTNRGYKELRGVLKESWKFEAHTKTTPLTEDDLLRLKRQLEGKSRFSFCVGCLCQWGGSGL